MFAQSRLPRLSPWHQHSPSLSFARLDPVEGPRSPASAAPNETSSPSSPSCWPKPATPRGSTWSYRSDDGSGGARSITPRPSSTVDYSTGSAPGTGGAASEPSTRSREISTPLGGRRAASRLQSLFPDSRSPANAYAISARSSSATMVSPRATDSSSGTSTAGGREATRWSSGIRSNFTDNREPIRARMSVPSLTPSTTRCRPISLGYTRRWLIGAASRYTATLWSRD